VTTETYVSKAENIEFFLNAWEQAKAGTPSTVLLTAPYGGGKRALVAKIANVAKEQDDDVLIFRPILAEGEDGQNMIIKLYAGILSYLHSNLQLRGKVELALNSRKPNQPQRVQNWITAFIDGMKQGSPKAGENQFQLHIPQDNPLIGFVELVHVIAQAYPVILEIQNIHNTHSIAIISMIKALIHKNAKAKDTKLMTILSSVPLEANASWLCMPLQDVLKEEADKYSTLNLDAWNIGDVEQYLASKEYSFGMAEQIVALTNGRPGFIAELADSMQEDEALRTKVATATLAELYDLTPDADELDSDDEEVAENKRPKAKADDAAKIAYISSLLGMSFPSGIVADMLAFDRSSVDDIYDATDGIYKEVERSAPLNTWIYQFRKAMMRESVLARFQSEDDKRVAGNTGAFLERFLAPVGFGYVIKALHIYADAGVTQRADVMRNVALGADQPQVWNLARDIFRYFADASWSDQLMRSVYMNRCERMSRLGDVNPAEDMLKEALRWAESKEDETLRAFLNLSGSRLDARRNDLYRARERATSALEIYRKLDSAVNQAECLAQLALVEFNDGKLNASLDRVNQADALTDIPPLRGLTSFIRGLIAQKDNKQEDALKHFNLANQLAGQSGRGALALDAGMKMGEVLLQSRQFAQAADTLGQVQQIAQGIGAKAQERVVCAMRAQALASQQNFEAALTSAQRAFQISNELKDRNALPADLYNVGLFQLMLQRPSEAIAFLKEARRLANTANAGFMKEVLFHLGQAQYQLGERSSAAETLQEALRPTQETRDANRALAIYQVLGKIARDNNDVNRAETMYNNALTIAKQVQNKEAQKVLKEQIKNLR